MGRMSSSLQLAADNAASISETENEARAIQNAMADRRPMHDILSRSRVDKASSSQPIRPLRRTSNTTSFVMFVQDLIISSRYNHTHEG